MKTRKHIGLFLVAGALLLLVAQPTTGQPDYTKGEQPATKDTKWAIGPTGAHGFFYHNDARQVLVDTFDGVDKGSPADGNLREGDVILGVLSPKTGQDTGSGKFTFDARRSMAIAIEEAEKKEHGGKLVLNVWRPNGKVDTQMHRPPGEPNRIRVNGKLVNNRKLLSKFHPDEPLSGKIMPVTLILPVMGSYSATSPYACEKSEALIKKTAEAIGSLDGIPGMINALGLLATGEEKYLERVREDIHRRYLGKFKDSDILKGGINSWRGGYNLLLLTEYYLLTKDEKILPDIKGLSRLLAQGVSGVGTWSHNTADVGLNGMYGPANGYGAMNQVSMVCAMGLVLAQKCGIEDPDVDKAVRLALDFGRYYVDRGCIPYGDHAPTMSYDNNGRMSVAAVLYDLAGDKEAAEYFTRMTIASYKTREGGHAGNFFSWQWGTLAAARGGEKAAASFAKNVRYFTELERRYDGKCIYQPQLPAQSRKNDGFETTGQRLLQYSLPRKVLYITGKGGSSVTPITGVELKKTVYAPLFDPKGLSTPRLLNALGFWAIPVRSAAAQELGKRDDNVVDELIAMLDSPDRYARYGACEGLRYAGRQSTKAVDALINIIQNSNDMVLRYFAVNALILPPAKGGDVNGLGQAPRRATNALLKLATVYDPDQDPNRKLGREIAYVLFHDDHRGQIPRAFFPGGKGAETQDKALLIPALKSLLLNPNSEVRGWAASVLPRLPIEDLDTFWGEIYQATTIAAPSGVMFAWKMHINGISTMAKHNIKEGVDYAAFYVLFRDGWGNHMRKRNGIGPLMGYGRALEPYFEEMKNIITNHGSIRGGQRRGLLQQLEKFRTEPVPEMVSIKEHIKTKPEQQFLDWWEERQKKK